MRSVAKVYSHSLEEKDSYTRTGLHTAFGFDTELWPQRNYVQHAVVSSRPHPSSQQLGLA